MTNSLGKVVADFSTTLNLKTAIGATSATLDSATDDDGVALPTWTYFLTLDRKSANKEYIKCTLTSTALTDIYHVSRQGALTSGTTKPHRKGATVEITDFAIIKKMLDLLDGTTDLNASVPLKYDATATISNSNHLATKAYVDGVAIAGGADASTTVKGITKLSTAPASASNPIAVGDNDPRVPTTDENDALAGTSGTPSTSNKYVTNDDTATAATADKVARRLAGGNITVVTESANNNSTNAASTAYVDATITTYKNWTTTKNAADASTTQTIAHGLGKTPKFVRIRAFCEWASGAGDSIPAISESVYNWTTQSSVSFYTTGSSFASWAGTVDTTFTLNTNWYSGTQTWVITVDGTNISIAWTRTNNPTGTYTLLWEAQG